MKRVLVAAIVFLTVRFSMDGRPYAAPAVAADQEIIHVLNRIGFGARPGDVERVRQIGLAKYIDQQLHPESIDNSRLTQKLASFETLKLSVPQLLEGYPQPAMIARQLGIRNA